MKIKKLKKVKYPFLELQILKLYNKKKSFNSKIELKLTEILLNKIANITYLYHITRKTILFIGFPHQLTKVLTKTRHLNIPDFMWLNNMLNNNTSFLSKKKKSKIPKNIIKLQTKLKKKVDLIVIHSLNAKNKTAFKESSLAHIPIIAIDKKFDDIKKQKSAYNSTGSYNIFTEKAESTNFFFLFFKTIILKAKRSNKNLLKKHTEAYTNRTKGRKLSYPNINPYYDQYYKNKKL